MSAITKSIIMLSLTLAAFVYGAAYDTYRLESQEIKGKNRICYYENVRGEGPAFFKIVVAQSCFKQPLFAPARVSRAAPDLASRHR